jgi:hypothetical protein
LEILSCVIPDVNGRLKPEQISWIPLIEGAYKLNLEESGLAIKHSRRVAGLLFSTLANETQ